MTDTSDISLFERIISSFLSAIDALAECLHYEKLAKIALDAAVFNLGYAGEYADQTSKEFRKQFDWINWNKLIRTRHIIFHGYHHIDPGEIRTILTKNVPQLLKHFEAILKTTKEEK